MRDDARLKAALKHINQLTFRDPLMITGKLLTYTQISR